MNSFEDAANVHLWLFPVIMKPVAKRLLIPRYRCSIWSWPAKSSPMLWSGSRSHRFASNRHVQSEGAPPSNQAPYRVRRGRTASKEASSPFAWRASALTDKAVEVH